MKPIAAALIAVAALAGVLLGEEPVPRVRLIIRADDMGVSHAVNEACIRACREGIATSVEVIAPAPWFPEAARLLAENPGIDVGVHLALTSEWENLKWRPLTRCPSLVDADGHFHPMVWPNRSYGRDRALAGASWKLDEIEGELRAQIELLRRKVPRTSHLSAHMGFTGLAPEVGALVKRLAAEYGLLFDLEELGVKRAPGYAGSRRTPEEKVESLAAMIDGLQPGAWLFIDHPGLDTPELRAIHHLGYEDAALDRHGVTVAFTDPKVKEAVRRRGIELLSYAALKRSPAPAPAASPGPEGADEAPGVEEISWNASGKRGAVAAGGKGAVAAGLGVLKAGGNAIDAAAATILALSVTDSSAFCFGGEVPILVYDARRRVVEALSGQGAAPRLATRAHFAARGGIPARGLEPAAVPAVLDVLLTALDRYGSLTLERCAAPALAILDRGERAWHPDLARTLRRLIEAERGSGGDRKRGLRLAADCFYRGPIARELAAWCEANGGLIRYSDLATHATRVEEAVRTDYRGHAVYKCGPWTQGPYLLEALNLLEGFDLKAAGHNTAEGIHLIAEAMKLALADRDVFYADPLFEEVPLEKLLSREYAELRRPLIDRQAASLLQRPGDPRGGKALLAEPGARAGLGGPAHDTTTCLVADGEGNVVAATPSGWSGVVAGRTGVWLGTRLQSFNTWEGHPNCIAPGKRPRITLTPTLVLKDGKPVLAVSVAGGDGQDQATLQMVIDAIDFDLPPAESVTAARFGTDHHLGSFRQPPPKLGSLQVYERLGEAVIADLRARGHRVQTVREPLSSPCVIAIDPRSGAIHAAGDPRARRHAAAY